MSFKAHAVWPLRQLAICAAIFSGVSAYTLDWAEQRRVALTDPDIRLGNTCREPEVWANMSLLLRLAGEKPVKALNVPESKRNTIRRLFPESIIKYRPDGTEPTGPMPPQ